MIAKRYSDPISAKGKTSLLFKIAVKDKKTDK